MNKHLGIFWTKSLSVFVLSAWSSRSINANIWIKSTTLSNLCTTKSMQKIKRHKTILPLSCHNFATDLQMKFLSCLMRIREDFSWFLKGSLWSLANSGRVWREDSYQKYLGSWNGENEGCLIYLFVVYFIIYKNPEGWNFGAGSFYTTSLISMVRRNYCSQNWYLNLTKCLTFDLLKKEGVASWV